jgi:magnesium-transporting ATPase (P-type)
MIGATDGRSLRPATRSCLLMVLLQNVHVFNCRSESQVPFSRNRILVAGVLAAHGFHILALHLPFMQTILRTEPVSLAHWGALLLLCLPLLGVMEIYKRIRARSLAGGREK